VEEPKGKGWVVVGVPCNKFQVPKAWTSLFDLRGPINNFIAPSGAMTDGSRNFIAKEFLSGSEEWLFFVDDDVRIPPDALERFLDHELPFCSGVYYRGSPPYDPLVSQQLENGWYKPIHDWEEGAVFAVDSTGLGCCLIHRRVFEAIQEAYQVCRLVSDTICKGSLKLIRKDRIREAKGRKGAGLAKYEGLMVGGMFVEHYEPTELFPEEKYPFFLFQNGRTEDHYFCELARSVGVPIVVDTLVQCTHWHTQGVGREDFERVKAILRERQAQVAKSP